MGSSLNERNRSELLSRSSPFTCSRACQPSSRQPRHRAPDLCFALIEAKKPDKIETWDAHPGRIQALKLRVRNPVIDNADAAVAVAILKAFESVEQEAVITAVNRAMDDDAAIEADRLVHPLRFGERCACDRRGTAH
jgi:hypothetical protein